jgi:hypothetical protein
VLPLSRGEIAKCSKGDLLIHPHRPGMVPGRPH